MVQRGAPSVPFGVPASATATVGSVQSAGPPASNRASSGFISRSRANFLEERQKELNSFITEVISSIPTAGPPVLQAAVPDAIPMAIGAGQIKGGAGGIVDPNEITLFPGETPIAVPATKASRKSSGMRSLISRPIRSQ